MTPRTIRTKLRAKNIRYKYFSNVAYAERFMAGEVYHQTLAYFRDYEVFVFCTSYARSDELIAEFKAVAYVEILRMASFENRWKRSLPKGATSFARRVDYYPPDDGPGVTWALPERIATSKCSRALGHPA